MKTTVMKAARIGVAPWLVGVALLSALGASSASAQTRELVLIANVKNSVAALTPAEAKQLFLKKKEAFANGVKVVPVDRSGTPAERVAFLAKVVELTPTEFERYWLEQQYARAVRPPKQMQNGPAVVALVAAFDGGLGFVAKESLTPDDLTKVKVVLTVSY